jgi:1-acyl-sn-glycerol-3-phosphate acyltransferase
MVWIRSVLFFVLFVLNTGVFSLAIVLAWPVVPVETRRWIGRVWSRVNLLLLDWICGLRYRVEGLDNLPPAPFVIMSKHQSAWETVAFYALFPPFVWVLKSSLGWIPLFGWVLRATDQIFIDRKQTIESLKIIQEQSRLHFAQGVSLVVFPEGTRVSPGVVGEYQGSGVVVAMAAGVPIVPVAHNAGSFWGRRDILKHPGEIVVSIGEPIPTAGVAKSGRKALLDRVRTSIETRMARLEQRVPT